MDVQDTPSVLAVGAQLANLARAKATGDLSPKRASLVEVSTAREAMALLRVVPFDLVAVGQQIVDADAQEFVNRLTVAKPWQKWVLVADEGLEAQEEAAIRSLGPMAILEGVDAWQDVVAIAARLRKARPQTIVPGLQLQSAR